MINKTPVSDDVMGVLNGPRDKDDATRSKQQQPISDRTNINCMRSTYEKAI